MNIENLKDKIEKLNKKEEFIDMFTEILLESGDKRTKILVSLRNLSKSLHNLVEKHVMDFEDESKEKEFDKIICFF